MTGTATIRTLVVDDEPLARRRLRTMLAEHPDVAVVGECVTAAETADAIAYEQPDLVLLDVAMPEGDGFGALAGPGGAPAVVFVTAYPGHAARAFDVAAVDFLVKPYGRQRLAVALDRVRAHLAGSGTPPGPPAASAGTPRVALEVGRRTRLLDPREIDYLKAEGNYVRVYATAGDHLVRGSLTDLLSRLDQRRFQRVHRSFAVRLDRVVEVETLRHGELALRLRGGAVVISGRRYRDQVRAALGLPAAG